MTALRSAFSGAFEPTLGDTIIAEVEKASAFQSVSRQAQVSGNGLIVPVIGRGKANWVAEGQPKLASDANFDVLRINPHVLQRTVIFSNQLLQDNAKLAEYIIAEAKGSLAVSYDQSVAGEISSPVGFASLAAAGEVTITNYATFRAAIASKAGKPKTAIVMNAALLDELSAVVNAAGAPILNIVGDYVSGTINGLPYRVFESDSEEPVGFAGAFNRMFYGVVPGSFSATPLKEVAYDENGQLIGLASRNLAAVLVEMRVGAAYVDLADFNKVVSSVPAA